VPRRDRRLEAIRRNPRGVRFEDLRRALESRGFEARRPGSGSSHLTYSHPALSYNITVVERRPVVLEVYVRMALKAIDEVLEAEGA
jgi:predicted RNA binding protein YcfA (HicA-like mRNA interferase family)